MNKKENPKQNARKNETETKSTTALLNQIQMVSGTFVRKRLGILFKLTDDL